MKPDTCNVSKSTCLPHATVSMRARIVIVFTLILLVSACGLNPLQRVMYSDYYAKPLHENLQKSAYISVLNAIVEMETYPGSGKKVFDPSCADGTTKTEEQLLACKISLATVGNTLVANSNSLCQQHMASIFGNESAFNIITGTATSLFAGAATVVGGESAKSLLGAAAAFTNAERSLINETVYKSMLTQAITKKINEIRITKFNGIKSRIESLNDHPYGIAELINDTLDYHNDCSFMVGLQKALDEGTGDNSVALKLSDLQRKALGLQLEMDARMKALNMGTTKNCANDSCRNDSVCKLICERYDAIAVQIKALETEVHAN